ncbi:MAG: ABC transporter substrate-binding protein [Oliverpabstia sp.]
MKKRLLSAVLVGGMTASLLCSSVNVMAEEASEPITISFWCNFTGSDGDVLREIVADYNETNTDNVTVEIDIMDYSTLQAKLPTAISTGNGPSFVLAGIELMQQYVDNDMLEPIDDFWEVTGLDQSNYYENVLAKSYINGVQYGVPMQYNLQYLYYNKDLFEAAGLDPNTPPKTLDELAKYAEATTDTSKNQYGIALPVDFNYYCMYLWENGGDVINADATENLLNSESNIETLTWIQDLAAKGVSPQGISAAEADTLFQAGQLAMYTSGPWNINGLNSLGINYGITAIPSGSDGAYSPEGGCDWMLSKGADDATRAAAYKFMAYWLSDDVLKEWSNRNGFPVWSYSVLEDEEIQNNEILNNVSEASSIGRDWHLGLAAGSQIDNDVMQPMMERILAGEDVKGCVEEASAILDEVLAAQ